MKLMSGLIPPYPRLRNYIIKAVKHNNTCITNNKGIQGSIKNGNNKTT